MKKHALLALAFVGCTSTTKPEVIPSQVNLPSPPPISCHMAMVAVREKLADLEILDDNSFLPEGPFMDMLDVNTACSPLMLALNDALDREKDVCKQEETEKMIAQNSGEDLDDISEYLLEEIAAINATIASGRFCANARHPFPPPPKIPEGIE